MENIEFDFNVPEDPIVELYDPEDKLVLRTRDEHKFLYLCCQIKDHKAEGYYVVIPEEMEKIRQKNPDAETIKYDVLPSGRVKGAGGKMFWVEGKLLRELI